MKETYGNKLLRGTIVITIVGLLAKLAAFITEAILASYIGTTYQSDAYYTVMSLHDVVYPMMHIGIWQVFLPLYKGHVAKQEHDLAYRLVNKSLCFFTAISAAVVLLIAIFSPAVVSVVAPGFDGITKSLCIHLVRISSPMYLFIVASTVYAAILQCHDKFLGSQIREVASYIPKIVAAIFFYKKFGIEAMAIALVASAVLRLLIELPFVNWGYKCKLDFKFRDSEFALLLQRLPSALVTAGVAQINTLVDKVMASTLPTGTISGLNYGHRLMNVFSGLLSSAISTAMYPQMIELIALDKKKELGQLVVKIINFFCILMIPVTIACALFRTELVSAVFQRGAFDANSTVMTANIFALYCLGLFFIACNTIISNIFYGHGDTKTAMHISIMHLGINVVLNLILIRPLGVNGLALATSVSAIVTFFARLILTRKYVVLKLRLMLATGCKVLIASVIACLIPRTIFWLYPVNKYLLLILSGLIGVSLYFVIIKCLKVSELNDLTALLRRKLKKA